MKTITIEVKGDSKKESDETFYLDLSGNSGNSLFTKNRGTGTILNDDYTIGDGEPANTISLLGHTAITSICIGSQARRHDIDCPNC